MPNYVRNKLDFVGDVAQIEKLMETVQGEDTLFDFNKIIPMPKELEIDESTEMHRGLEAYKLFLVDNMLVFPETATLADIPKELEKDYCKKNQISKRAWNLGKAAYRNLRKFGFATWYKWCTETWGSKWNAMDICKSTNSISFNTAWSRVMPIITQLSRMFPDITITYSWADEDTGCNAGIAKFANGQLIHDEPFEKLSAKAYELAAELWEFDLKERGYIFSNEKQTYVYVSDC